MTWEVVAFLLVPVLAVTLVFGVIVVVALRRARPEDVPDLVRESSRGLMGLIRRDHRSSWDDDASRSKEATR